MLSPKDRKVLSMFHDRHFNQRFSRWDDETETEVFDAQCEKESRAWDYAIEIEGIEDIYGEETVDLESRGYLVFDEDGWWHYTWKAMSELGLK